MDERALYATRFTLMGGSAENEALRIERKFFRCREKSVVSEIARNAGRTPVAIDEGTVALIESALDLARRTGGRFDPTAGCCNDG